MEGVIRTRVGYAGGEQPDPTYYDLGNYSETIQIDYDPIVISYEELLHVYWASHNATTRSFSTQYASKVFYHDEEQKRIAEQVQKRVEAEQGPILTQLVPYTTFYLAEDYHQKYRLSNDKELMAEFRAIYPDINDLINSTAAARVNGYLDGEGSLGELEAIIDQLGISAAAQERLLKIAARHSP